MRDTQKWLKARFKGPFTELGNVLAHGTQHDAISCIPCSANTIAHGVFGEPLWQPETRFVDRFRWFRRLVAKETQPKMQAETRTGTGITLPPVQAENQANVSGDGTAPAISSVVRPALANLLNPSEDMAFGDIMQFMHLEVEEEFLMEAEESGNLADEKAMSNEQMEDESGNAHTMDVDDSPQYEPSSSSARAPSPNTAANPPKHSQKDAWASLFAQKKSTTTTTSKRKRDNTGESKNAKKLRGRSPSPQRGGPTGLSKAAKSEAASRKAADEGVVDAGKREKWKQKILSIDAHAEFDEQNLRAVRCSNCRRSQLVKSANNVSRFESHWKACRGKKRGGGMKTLTHGFDGYFTKHDHTRTAASKAPPRPLPCPGLSSADDPRVKQYLRRSAAPGGGARSIHVISCDLFHKSYRKLSSHDKQSVLDTQFHEHTWRNDHEHMRTFSTTCNNITIESSRNGRRLPCRKCRALLEDKRFTRILNKDMPAQENYKFTNRMYRNQVLGEQYASVKGLKELIEEVCVSAQHKSDSNCANLGCRYLSICSFCTGRSSRKVSRPSSFPGTSSSYGSEG